ncbi:Metallo-dependent phosphatase-like protein [Boletus edulis BED1]|uniref:Purple acid phosphatase n=1 Tax=Boletus edulis BED1 TaxID=1328754 RepID=A0AAD4BFM1_BOLED|nr:Metallo-dependent phosphatase-like protein [Boletus edulis BED1]
MLQRTLVAAAVTFLGGVNAQIYLSNYSYPFSCLAESTGVHVPGTVPCNPVEPLQQHLAFAGAGGMTVSWSTHSQLDNPQVFYGESPTALTNIAYGTSTTYPSSRVWDNHVKITGLKSNTQYWYRVSNQNCPGCAYRTTDTFTTALETGDETPFTIAVVIDLGLMGADGLSTKVGPYGGAANPLGPNDLNTIQSLIENKDTYEFIAHFGDIAYSDYFIKESWEGYFGNNSLIPNTTSVIEGYNVLLEQYYDQMSTLTSSKAYMVGPGNHEANCDNGGTTDKIHNITYTTSICVPGQLNFTGYINHFRMPSEESGGVGNFWYSFDYGLAHFVVLNTETDLPVGLVSPDGVGGVDAGANNGPFGYPNEQYDWFEKDLASVDRDKTPWIVVGLHRPWYIGIQNDSSADVCLQCQQAFEPLMIKYGVDLYMQGHVHVYERNAPIANYSLDPNGLNNPSAPWNIVNGAAGHYDGLDTLEPSLPYWSVNAFDTAYGWSRLTFHNRTHLTHEFVASANGTVLDSATLYKAHHFSNGNGQGGNSQ